MKVLVTGAAGFIGGQLMHALWKNGHTAVGVDNYSYGSADNLHFDDHDFSADVIKMDIRDKEEIDAVAIGGLVQEKLSRLPKVGDHFVWGSFDGTVTRATNRRVQEVRLVSRPTEPETKKADRRDRDKD